MTHRHPRHILTFAAPAAVLLALSVGPAQAHPLYDTTRVLPQQGNACLKPANCKVIEGDREVIRQSTRRRHNALPGRDALFPRAGTSGATSTSPSSCSTTAASR